MTQKKEKPTTIVVLPDAHADPDYDNERFTALGRMLVDLADENVNLKLVCLGDFGDFNSLSFFGKGKRCNEGKRYEDDVKHFHDAMRKLLEPMRRAGKTFADMVFTIGNHEMRINTYVENDATLEGTMGIEEDLKLESYGWRVSPFLTPVEVDGFCFAHFAISGALGKPVSGINVANTMLSKGHTSMIVGHSHLRNFAEQIGYDGKRRIAIVAGCFYDFNMNWTSKQVNNLAWRGVVVLRNVKDGDADVSFVGLDSIMNKYHPRPKQVMKKRKLSGMEYRPTFMAD